MIVFALAALAIGLSSEGISSRLDVLEARAADLKLGEAVPFAILSVDGAFGNPYEVLGIYVYWDAPYGQVGRRRAIALAKHEINTTDVVWASSQTCADLEAVVAEMEDVMPPSLNVPGVGKHERFPKMVADGVIYTLSARWPRWEDHEHTNGYHISFSANVGNPLGTWSEALRTTASSCWSSIPPEAG